MYSIKRFIFTPLEDFLANSVFEEFPPLKKLPIKTPNTIAKAKYNGK
jgi:hypothetical protein